MKRKIWYFGLEPLKERYTHQLSTQWMPSAFEDYDVEFIHLKGDRQAGEIKVGSVLDAYGRGAYSMSQCQKFMKAIAKEEVQNNDVVFLQDFWTPGIEAVFYMLDLYNIEIKLYSMLHAQSVDEYDFTYPMAPWMRPFELGIDAKHSGIFVGSTIHREQLRASGFKAPIHVMSLPFGRKQALQDAPKINDHYKKKNQVVFTSRFDKEKNPYFMMEVAKDFLARNKSWNWVVTTSGSDFRSSMVGVVKDMKSFAKSNPRFVLKSGLTKEEYYGELMKSKIQFNSSLQDYVSWTLIESTLFDCDVVYPNFRSFPEILHKKEMYKPFNLKSAVKLLNKKAKKQKTHQSISKISDMGRRAEAYIVINDLKGEYNIWHEFDLFNKLINS